MKNISLKLPNDVDQELTSLAERKGVTKSALIREAVGATFLTIPPARNSRSLNELET
jgi:predicted DNA-binding protein